MKITSESHLDHGLSAAHKTWLLKHFAGRAEFFLVTVDMPAELPSLMCGLHGPLVGGAPVPEEAVFYAKRGDRAGASRLVRRKPQETRLVTVIAGPHAGENCVLYTAFGGPSAPREPFDPGLDDAGLAESQAFWAQHALSEAES